jgi:hypothetical protein
MNVLCESHMLRWGIVHLFQGIVSFRRKGVLNGFFLTFPVSKLNGQRMYVELYVA